VRPSILEYIDSRVPFQFTGVEAQLRGGIC